MAQQNESCHEMGGKPVRSRLYTAPMYIYAAAAVAVVVIVVDI